ncbi:MAG: relaxase [Gammaproteobacteria bacterium]|nr:relaxase [Gammaproteobacteria bacterium]
MILKASERGHARALSLHLMNADQNEHVDIHEIRGLASSNLHTALQEIDAASMGTQCKKPFFHVQLSPPAKADLTVAQYEKAVEDVEKKLGLVGHPRAIVFHEKDGRRHAHAVWSRLHEKEITRTNRDMGEKEQGQKLVAKQLPHFKIKLNELSLALFYENGLEPPKGLVDKSQRDPNNYDLKIWQQANRLKEDPRDLKQLIRTALESSDSRGALEAVLKDHGMYLAQGNKRSFLAVHHSGEPMSLTRYSGMKGKEITAKIGEAKDLPTLAQVQTQIRDQQSQTIKKRLDNLKLRQQTEASPLRSEKTALTQNHRDERANLKAFQKERGKAEALVRAKRLRKGIAGMWDRVSGKRGRVARRNEQEIKDNRQRDRDARQEVVTRQLAERQELQQRMRKLKTAHDKEQKLLVRELGHSVQINDKVLTNEFNDQVQGREQDKQKDKVQDGFNDAAKQGEKDKLSISFNEKAETGRKDKKADEQKKGQGRTRKRDPD